MAARGAEDATLAPLAERTSQGDDLGVKNLTGAAVTAFDLHVRGMRPGGEVHR
jgi:hypothetical protein